MSQIRRSGPRQEAAPTNTAAASIRRRRRVSRELDRLCGLPLTYGQRARDDFWDAWDRVAA